MDKEKLIVVEGPQGVGKTTVTDYIRDTLKATNLYRLTGTNDATIEGKAKASEMYYSLLNYIKTLENKSLNLLFDRTFFSEENYCRLGKKAYSFTDVYNELLKEFVELNFEIYIINLYLSDESQYLKRLERKSKVVVDYSKFSIDNSILQQNTYLEMMEELKQNYPEINVLNLDNSEEVEVVKEKVRKFINY